MAEMIICPTPGCGGELVYSQHGKTVRALDEASFEPPEELWRCSHDNSFQDAARCPQEGCHKELRKTAQIRDVSDAIEQLESKGVTFWECRKCEHPDSLSGRPLVAMLPNVSASNCPKCGAPVRAMRPVTDWRKEHAAEHIKEGEELPNLPTIWVCDNFHFFIPPSDAPLSPVCGKKLKKKGRIPPSDDMILLVCPDFHYYVPEPVCLVCGRGGLERHTIRKVRAIEDIEAEERRRKGYWLCPKCKSMFPAKMIAQLQEEGVSAAPVAAPAAAPAPCKCVEQWEVQLHAEGKFVKMPLSEERATDTVRCAECNKDYRVKWEVVKRDDNGAWEISLTISYRVDEGQ